MIVITITLLKPKFIFFHNNSKKQDKKVDANFVLLSQSTITTGQFIKIYLHKEIKILQILTGEGIHKCLAQIKNY